jgi:hypothetical protein
MMKINVRLPESAINFSRLDSGLINEAITCLSKRRGYHPVPVRWIATFAITPEGASRPKEELFHYFGNIQELHGPQGGLDFPLPEGGKATITVVGAKKRVGEVTAAAIGYVLGLKNPIFQDLHFPMAVECFLQEHAQEHALSKS